MHGDELKQARQKLGLTQARFGEQIGRGRRCVRKYECGQEGIPKVVDLAVKYLLIQDQIEEEKNE